MPVEIISAQQTRTTEDVLLTECKENQMFGLINCSLGKQFIEFTRKNEMDF